MTDTIINLQRFAEGAGDGGAGEGAGTGVTPQAAAADTGAGMPDAAASTNRSGRQQPAAQDDAAQRAEAKAKYKFYDDNDVQSIIRGRLKDADADRQTLSTLQPMLEGLARQYGIDPKNHQALVDKVLDSDSLYEEEAMRTGMSVEAVKQIKKLQAANAQQAAQLSQFTEQAQAERHIMQLVQQAEALKTRYPGFDLQQEMQNEAFVRYTSPGVGMSVEQAYVALHHGELQQMAMQAAAQQSRRQAAQTVQANMARPRENAGRSAAPAAQVYQDPSMMTREQIADAIRRANAGERVGFD